jgi:hypothetical protein
MINKFKELKKHHQLGFSLIIVSSLICLWRGIWGLLDIYLFPTLPTMSYSVSLLIGVGVLLVTHYTIDKIV